METAQPTTLGGRVSAAMLDTEHMFGSSHSFVPEENSDAMQAKKKLKVAAGYVDCPPAMIGSQSAKAQFLLEDQQVVSEPHQESVQSAGDGGEQQEGTVSLVIAKKKSQEDRMSSAVTAFRAQSDAKQVPVPKWHAPWELSTVIAGHLGWVRSIGFDPSNEFFATGSSDRTIKIWDFAKCCAGAEDGLKLTITGHVDTVRAIEISSRHPYLFSASEDKNVKCWDLETNKCIRNYHGHMSGVFSLALHPTLDLLVTGGRDSVARVWDMRTRKEVHCLRGHEDAVGTIATNSVDPQIITGSFDSTVKLWDLAAGKVMTTLTHHKKSVRSVCANPREFTFASASADGIRKWQSRGGKLLKKFDGHKAVINSIAMNEDGVMVSSADNGTMQFWDYDTGYSFQQTETVAQPGSLDSEAGIFASKFDMSGSRLVTCEADKSIKIWKEKEDASEDSHPIDMRSWTDKYLA